MTLENKIQRSENYLIPPRTISNLVFDQSLYAIDKSANNFFSLNKRSEIRKLSAIVFKNKTVLDKEINQITEYPNSVHAFATLVRENPEHFGELAGFYKFGLKTPGRIKAERNILKLSDTIIEYARIVDEMVNSSLKEMQRLEQSVEMLSDDVMHLLNQPSDIRRDILQQQDTSQLYKELSYFLDDIAFRLSASEHKMLRNGNYKMLAESLDVSEYKAQEIIDTVEKVESVQQEIQRINENIYNIYEHYTPYEKHMQNSENFLNSSEEIDSIYDSPPHEAQTQNSESFLNSSEKIDPIYENYNPNKTQTQNSENFLNSSEEIDSIYDSPPHEAQTQNSESFLNSSEKIDPIYENYNPNKTQTQNSENFLNSSEEIDSIYDSPPHEAQTQNSESFLNSSEKIDPIYENYNPNKTQTQNSENFLNSSEEIDSIYDSPPHEAQTQNSESFLNSSEKIDPIYENYNPNKTQTQNSENFLNSSEEIDSIYDSPPHEAQTQNSESFLNSSEKIDPIYENYNPNKTQTQNSENFLNSSEKIDPIYENRNPNKTQTQNSESFLNSEDFLIPPKKLAPLTQYDINIITANNSIIQQKAEQIRNLSELVFGNRELFNSILREIIEKPKIGEGYSKILEISPQSFAKFAGFKKWWFKNSRHKTAEKNAPKLCEEIRKYTDSVKIYQKQTLYDHKKEQQRAKQAVLMPSDKMQHLLNMPSDMWENTLIKQDTSQLHKEFSDFLSQVNSRLSIHERIAIKHNDYQTLAHEIKVPKVKARQIINVVKKAQECQQKIKDIISQQQEQMIAVAL
ncbi:BID domain-containing T4SS effector [Bartonella sp. C271]|uniref:BID domain-containing T4SS effector n=1 Tax=Bartonella sp. C271 TaxID=3070220 RepID=UPI003D812824